MGQALSNKIDGNVIHDLATCVTEFYVTETTEYYESEWHRLAINLGINVDQDVDIYKKFKNYVTIVTNGKYSRIRSYQDLDDVGKRLLQLILDYQRLERIKQDRNNVNKKIVIGVASFVGVFVLVTGFQYFRNNSAENKASIWHKYQRRKSRWEQRQTSICIS